MEEMEFEQALRTQLENFNKRPPQEVWENIQTEIQPKKWNRIRRFYSIAASIALLMMAAFGWNWAGKQSLVQGEHLYEKHCQSCHASEDQNQLALVEAVYRYDEPWLISFTRNSKALIEANDPAALKLWSECLVPDFHQLEELSNQELRAIYSYIRMQ